MTHIDDGAIAAVGALYDELGITGAVLDLMSSWVSHFREAPRRAHGARHERRRARRQPAGVERVVHDLNADPRAAVRRRLLRRTRSAACRSTTSTRPVEVFRDVAACVRPGGLFVCTFSNRLFPTKAIRGWLGADDAQHHAS